MLALLCLARACVCMCACVCVRGCVRVCTQSGVVGLGVVMRVALTQHHNITTPQHTTPRTPYRALFVRNSNAAHTFQRVRFFLLGLGRRIYLGLGRFFLGHRWCSCFLALRETRAMTAIRAVANQPKTKPNMNACWYATRAMIGTWRAWRVLRALDTEPCSIRHTTVCPGAIKPHPACYPLGQASKHT